MRLPGGADAAAIGLGVGIAVLSFHLLPPETALASCLLGWVMLAIATIDARRFTIPDLLSLPAIVLGLLASGRMLDPSINALVSVAPTFRWPRASSISLSCSTGSRGGCCRGGCRSRWKPPSASRRCRRLWRATASRRSSTRTKARSSPARLHRPAGRAGDQDQHGWQGRVDAEHRFAMTRDNVFVERLWRTIKYEEVYLHAYENVSAARAGIGRYVDLYNRRRPHSSLDGMTPDQAYFGTETTPPIRLAA